MKAFTAAKKILGSAALASLCLLSSCKAQESEYPKNETKFIELDITEPENSLHLIFNGEDIGEIYEFDGTQCGSAGLRGGNGCMFKNIRLTPETQS